MKMTFRWFGEGNDPIPLQHIKQIPGMHGIVWALHDLPPGEVWPLKRIQDVKKQADQYGFSIDVVESVNVHEDIKLGLQTRDLYIENYKRTIENLAQVGVKVICYNFMPVFDWFRSDLYKPLSDGATALFYDHAQASTIKPEDIVNRNANQLDYKMPGWEPERLHDLKRLFEAYEGITEEDLWRNLDYFLQQIIPVAEQHGISMAIHPDDPPWSIFGLPRIVTNKENLRRILSLVDRPSNGITLCSGSLGANPLNDIAGMIREFSDRIPFAHIRNVKVYENGDFIETSHRTQDGSVDVYEIVKAYHDIGFTGYVRPDHGRHIWGEECRPGYGLYDRALGVMYLWGIWDSLERMDR